MQLFPRSWRIPRILRFETPSDSLYQHSIPELVEPWWSRMAQLLLTSLPCSTSDTWLDPAKTHISEMSESTFNTSLLRLRPSKQTLKNRKLPLWSKMQNWRKITDISSVHLGNPCDALTVKKINSNTAHPINPHLPKAACTGCGIDHLIS